MLPLLAYNTVLTLAAPIAAAGLVFSRRHAPLLGRFRPKAGPFPARPLWVHACSVGEVNAARPLLKAAAERWPTIPILLTVSTVTGREQAENVPGATQTAWFPWDLPWSVRGFLRRVQPRALVLLETELWPNVLRETARAGVPVMLASGRLSDKHYASYQRWGGVLRPLLPSLCAGMQNPAYAERLIALGAAADNVRVTGNIKFDLELAPMTEDERQALRQAHGFGVDDLILLFGSTRPGDEALAAHCFSVLKPSYPNLALVVAPRHVQRAEEVLRILEGPVLRRSAVKGGQSPCGERILLVDTLGELSRFYGIADIAVIGGSFYPGVEGHNPLESAAQGVPTVFGSYMRNVADLAQALTAVQGACAVSGPDALPGVLKELLANPAQRAAMADRGRAAIETGRGAIRRTLDLIEPLL